MQLRYLFISVFYHQLVYTDAVPEKTRFLNVYNIYINKTNLKDNLDCNFLLFLIGMLRYLPIDP